MHESGLTWVVGKKEGSAHTSRPCKEEIRRHTWPLFTLGKTTAVVTFFFVSDIHHGPRLLNFFPERPDSRLVLLRELEGRLHLGRIVDDLAVELATLLNQSLLLFV